MGGLILITGASGFIGRACIAEALARGHRVVAVHRRAMTAHDGVILHRADLSNDACIEPLRGGLKGVTAVIHAAAHMGAGEADHDRDTMAPTRHLLTALEGHPAKRVLVSSLAVYDHDRMSEGDAVTEASPLQGKGSCRDFYSEAKLAQEALFKADGRPVWLMRPGAVWGPGRTWNALIGPNFGKLYVTVRSDGELPLTHVTQTAKALVSAAERAPDGAEAVNIFDDDRPTRTRFVKAHKAQAGWPSLTWSESWSAWKRVCWVAQPWKGRPGLMRKRIARARLMPHRFPNDHLRARLGGADEAPFEEMLRRSLGGEA